MTHYKGTYMLGIDYTDGSLSPQHILDAGYSFVGRYLSNSSWKNLTASEVARLHDAGIKIFVVWETTTGRTLDGYDAGVVDARNALSQATNLGMPDNRPIYFAVDDEMSDIQLNGVITDYFKGVNSVLGLERTGVYGGYATINDLSNNGVATFFWQTLAWSHGHVHDKTNVYQYNTNTNMVGGVDCDLNRSITDDFGQW